ncbi:DNA cytosine methyltransferase [Thalassoroseus pseudoceratinae]|uniref:DNA cytosine methyltransferase n=1 Tax=Thalassoroseus pseudoceratinae TaxID=2713176 RepID=UPI00197E606B|nr:DNA cytosine methyltransferase [Thalassoroseus pseudoceratinae]
MNDSLKCVGAELPACNQRWPTAVDLYSGCGGTTLGLRNARFRVVAGIENDPLAVETFKENHRTVKVWADDIRDVDPSAVLDAVGLQPRELDLLSGCPPCQAFSSLKRLNGGKRLYEKANKDLVFEIVRFARIMQPRVVMIENVPHLRRDYRFSRVRRELKELGYYGQPKVVNAAEFGVPQRRRRVILIASRIGTIRFPEPNQSKVPCTVRSTIASLSEAGRSGDALHDLPEVRSEKIARLIAMIPRDGGSRMDAGDEHQLACHRRCNGFKDVYGRMAWDDVAPTITGGCVNPSKGRFLHPEADRTITLREAALLQSFPLTYWFSLKRGKFAAAQMIGNAFPPALVAAHARQIRKHLKSGPA